MSDFEKLFYPLFLFKPTIEQKKLFSSLYVFLTKKNTDSSLFLLTGFAGTGKTSCIRALHGAARILGYRVVLLAPTGRSAKIISKNTQQKAHTLHREMYQPTQPLLSGDTAFKLKKNYKRNCLFIVDEASMIGSSQSKNSQNVLTDLISYVFENSGNKLVLVGDPAQLPPVGESMSLALNQEILTYAYQLNVQAKQLQEVNRQQEGSGILINATALREALQQGSNTFRFKSHAYPDFFQIPEEKICGGLAYAYQKYGQANSLLLCATNQDAFRFNLEIRNTILGRQKAVEPGDLLINNRNNYQVLPWKSHQAFLANGEFAEVVEVGEEEIFGSFHFINLVLQLPDYPRQAAFKCKILMETLSSAEASLEESRTQELYKLILQKYRPIRTRSKQIKAIRQDPYLNALHVKYAYALTCHKAQGGQWDAVFIYPGYWQQRPYTTDRLRWLYTAITRAEKELYLVAS